MCTISAHQCYLKLGCSIQLLKKIWMLDIGPKASKKESNKQVEGIHSIVYNIADIDNLKEFGWGDCHIGVESMPIAIIPYKHTHTLQYQTKNTKMVEKIDGRV